MGRNRQGKTFFFLNFLSSSDFEIEKQFFTIFQFTITAIPFKSDPALAAVAEVFGTLSVAVSDT